MAKAAKSAKEEPAELNKNIISEALQQLVADLEKHLSGGGTVETRQKLIDKAKAIILMIN